MALKITRTYNKTNKPLTYIRVRHVVDRVTIIASIHYMLSKAVEEGQDSLKGGYKVVVLPFCEKNFNRKGIEEEIRTHFESEGQTFMDRFVEEHLGGEYDFERGDLKEEDLFLFEEVMKYAEQFFPEWFSSNTEQYIRRVKCTMEI